MEESVRKICSIATETHLQQDGGQSIVISILATYPAHRNLLHVTNLPTQVTCINRTVHCYVISILATYLAHRNLLYFTILTTQVTCTNRTVPRYVISILATYPAHHKLLCFSNLTVLHDLPNTHSFIILGPTPS
jgi:hypothetical protein